MANLKTNISGGGGGGKKYASGIISSGYVDFTNFPDVKAILPLQNIDFIPSIIKLNINVTFNYVYASNSANGKFNGISIIYLATSGIYSSLGVALMESNLANTNAFTKVPLGTAFGYNARTPTNIVEQPMEWEAWE